MDTGDKVVTYVVCVVVAFLAILALMKFGGPDECTAANEGEVVIVGASRLSNGTVKVCRAGAWVPLVLPAAEVR